jgi:hypothetical protein
MMEDDITAILKEEKIEKDMRLAEMEANKASNLIQHQVYIIILLFSYYCVLQHNDWRMLA